MSDDKPFDGNRTIIRPNPRRRDGVNNAQPVRSPAPSRSQPNLTPTAHAKPIAFDHEQLSGASSVNMMLHFTSGLLAKTHKIRNQGSNASANLFIEIAQDVVTFQQNSLKAGYERYDVAIGSELICCFVDEIVRAMPWSHTTAWADQSLLNHLHQTTQGGEHFFVIVQKLIEHGKAKIDLIELAYILLSLGFTGRYGLSDGGYQALDTIKNQLYVFIEQSKGKPERALSVSWLGANKDQQQLGRLLPLWVTAAALSCLLLFLFTYLLFSLNKGSSAVAFDTISLTRDIPEYRGVSNSEVLPVVPIQASLRQLLAGEIQDGWLEVEDIDGGENVVLIGDRFFSSGSGKVNEKGIAIVQTIGQALLVIPGDLIISGHTDNVPIRTLQFPSNLVLSQARAQSVADTLNIDLQRIRVDARGDGEPRASNGSSEGRALNRRVEITLLKAFSEAEK